MTRKEILDHIENNMAKLKEAIERIEAEHFDNVVEYLKDVKSRVLSPVQKKHIKEMSDATANRIGELKEMIADYEEDREIILEEIKSGLK